MNCVICRHGQTKEGTATVTLQRATTTLIIKQVPADICDTCGEYYLSSEVSALILEKAEAAVRNGAEVEILRFAA